MRKRNAALVLCSITLAGIVIFGAASGRFQAAAQALRFLQMESRQYELDGYRYYMQVPKGKTPKGGWYVVVALHGLGQHGRETLWMAEQFTKAGAIFVSPIFTGYEPYPGDGPVEPLSKIIAQVGAKHPVQPGGAVLLGFSMGGTFAFRFSLRHPEQVRGVVTAGAPSYDLVLPAIPPAIPYIFTWGELDNLQERAILEDVLPLQAAGYNIKTYIVPEYAHQVTPLAIEEALKMIR